MDTKLKHCNNCSMDKPITEFGNRKTGKDGINSICKACIGIKDKGYSKKRYRKHRDAIIAATTIWRLEHPNQRLLATSKARAKRQGTTFSISLVDIVIPDTCPVLGIPIVLATGKGKPGGASAGSPSIDRVDNTKGYVSGNVQVISYRSNTLKRDASIEEVRSILRYMESHAKTVSDQNA